MLGRFRHFYGWCLRRGLVKASPFADQPGQPAVQFVKGVEQPRTRRLREGEEAALLANANPHLKALIVAALDTACRLGELLNLTFADVDDENLLLTIRPEVSKTNTQRRVPITARVKALVAMRRTAPDGKEHEPSKYVFGKRRRRAYTSTTCGVRPRRGCWKRASGCTSSRRGWATAAWRRPPPT
jgi:integrase